MSNKEETKPLIEQFNDKLGELESANPLNAKQKAGELLAVSQKLFEQQSQINAAFYQTAKDAWAHRNEMAERIQSLEKLLTETGVKLAQ